MSIASASTSVDENHVTADPRVAVNPRPRSRAWAIAGILAGIGSFVSVFISMMLSPEYVKGSTITPEQISEGLLAEQHLMIMFHIVTLAAALLNVVFAAGLHRRLAAATPAGSLAPTVALVGMVLVAVSQMMGTGLDTEFLFGVDDLAINLPSDIGFYSHWIATIPWLWVGGGLAGLAVGVSAFSRNALDGIPKWIGLTGIAIGGVTVLVALSPLQYMAAAPGAFWLCVTALGFSLGDRKKHAA